MNTGKVYTDSEGNECSIVQMVEREPQWAANMIQAGEEASERVAQLEETLRLIKTTEGDYDDAQTVLGEIYRQCDEALSE